MKVFQKINQFLTRFTIIAVLAAAGYLWFTNPSIFYTNTYELLDWLGLAVLVIVISYKISGYAGLFLNTKKAGIFMLVQLLICPILIDYLTMNYGLPVTAASAIAFAAISPGFIPFNIVVNLFMAACMLFLSIYVLPYSSMEVNEAYSAMVSPTTKYVLFGAAVMLVIYKLFKQHNQKSVIEKPKCTNSQYIHVKA